MHPACRRGHLQGGAETRGATSPRHAIFPSPLSYLRAGLPSPRGDAQAHKMADYAQRLSTPESYAAYGGPYGSGTVDDSEYNQDQSAYEAAVRSPCPPSDTRGARAAAGPWGAALCVAPCVLVPRPQKAFREPARRAEAADTPAVRSGAQLPSLTARLAAPGGAGVPQRARNGLGGVSPGPWASWALVPAC
jgi:hypothetical protein